MSMRWTVNLSLKDIVGQLYGEEWMKMPSSNKFKKMTLLCNNVIFKEKLKKFYALPTKFSKAGVK